MVYIVGLLVRVEWGGVGISDVELFFWGGGLQSGLVWCMIKQGSFLFWLILKNEVIA